MGQTSGLPVPRASGSVNIIRLQSALFFPTRETATIDTLPEFMQGSSLYCNKIELAAILFFAQSAIAPVARVDIEYLTDSIVKVTDGFAPVAVGSVPLLDGTVIWPDSSAILEIVP